jgi:F-type H+-transporting ATPase subunit b
VSSSVTGKESSVRAQWTCAAASGIALLLPGTLLAAEGLNLSPRPSLVLTNLVIVLLLIWPVNRLLIAPLVRVLQEREARTSGAGDQLAELREQGVRELEQLEARRNQARREAAERRLAILARGKAEEQRILGAAREEAAGALAQVRTSIAAELEEARAALRGDAQDLARLAAERILGRSL